MSLKDTCVSVWEAVPATLQAGGSLSESLNIGGLRLCAIALPSAWTAANITFQVSCDQGATWINLLQQDGTELSVTGAASSCVIVHPADFAAFQYIRVRSGTAAAPVAQAASRSLSLLVRSV